MRLEVLQYRGLHHELKHFLIRKALYPTRGSGFRSHHPCRTIYHDHTSWHPQRLPHFLDLRHHFDWSLLRKPTGVSQAELQLHADTELARTGTHIDVPTFRRLYGRSQTIFRID